MGALCVCRSTKVGDKCSRILMVGLDKAGKTAILYKIKLTEVVSTIPTIGFNVETVSPVEGLTFTVWDVGGDRKIRVLWRHYYSNVQGILYVVDSTDRERFSESRDELQRMLKDDEMRGVPVVVLANKQDLPGAAEPQEVAEQLKLVTLTDRKWCILGTSVLTSKIKDMGMQKMSEFLKLSRNSRRSSSAISPF